MAELPQKPEQVPRRSKAELEQMLRESLQSRRPKRGRIALISVLIVAGLLALLAWLMTLRGEGPPLTIIALDDVGAAGKEVTLAGVLEGPAETRARLDGRDIVFVPNQGPPLPGQTNSVVRVKSGRHGEATCQWKFPAHADQESFLVRLIGDKFRPGMEDRGWIYLYPSETRLCIVELEAVVADAQDKMWEKTRIQDIALRTDAGEALQKLQSQGFAVVYLALSAGQPILYQRQRSWINHRSAGCPSALPYGAVLSRFLLPVADQDAKPWQAMAKRVAAQFVTSGAKKVDHVAIASATEVARQFHTAGLRTLYLGEGKGISPAIERVADWKGVPSALEK
jgi:hypothetical protein